jgi:hypothetical protein
MGKEKVEVIQSVISNIPVAHRYPPYSGETFATRADAEDRLHNWSLFRGFAYVVDSSRQDEYVLLRCIHYKKEPWPSQQLDTTATYESRMKRNNTKFGGKGCLHSIRIGHVLMNQRYKNGPRHWILNVHGECLHPLCLDPMSY